MRTRPLGKTDLSVSEMSLGTWGLSGDGYGPVPEKEQDRVIDRALALGVTLFETADTYAEGGMEKKLGERLGGTNALIATKVGTDRQAVPPRKRFDEKFLRESFEHSRERIGRDPVDIVLLHNPAATTLERGEATGVLSELQASGRVRTWGVSAGSGEVARAALEQGAPVLSVPYNAFFATHLHEIHDEIEKRHTGVLVHSILSHGLLTGYWSIHKEFPEGDHRADRWTPDELRRRIHQLQALRAVVGGAVYTIRSVAIRYVLTNDDVASAVIGPKNVIQLDQLVREAGKGPPYLSEEKLQKLAARLEALGVSS